MKIDLDKYLSDARNSIFKAGSWREDQKKALHEIRFARAALYYCEDELVREAELARLAKDRK